MISEYWTVVGEVALSQDDPLSVDLTMFPYWPTATNIPEPEEEEEEELSEVLVELSEESSEDEVVLSVEVVDAPSSLLLAQEMMVRLKRDMRIMYKTLFIFFLHQ